MNGLVEVRGTNVAYEMRNGVKVEYATDDREARMRALGCPEPILKRIREKRSKRPAVVRTGVVLNEETLARAQGVTVAQLRAANARAADAALRGKAHRLARTMEAQEDADRRSRARRQAAQISEDAEQEKKDAALQERMQNAAGIVFGKRR